MFCTALKSKPGIIYGWNRKFPQGNDNKKTVDRVPTWRWKRPRVKSEPKVGRRVHTQASHPRPLCLVDKIQKTTRRWYVCLCVHVCVSYEK